MVGGIAMEITWQDIAALLLVAVAAIYLLRGLWRLGASRTLTGCTGCKGCPAAKKPLTSLQPIRRK